MNKEVVEGFRMTEKQTVAVLFGQRSVEHEISIVTALQLMNALDPLKYTILPVYIAQNGRWYTGQKLRERSTYRQFSSERKHLQEVILLPRPGDGGLFLVEGKKVNLEYPLAVDVFLPAFHGQYGEDGCMQGLLELSGIPYTGCGVLGSALSMSKEHAKAIARAHGISVLSGGILTREEARGGIKKAAKSFLEKEGLNFPLFVKPGHLGSSVGIGRAESEGELLGALALVFRYESVAIIEPCVQNLVEINVSVRGGKSPQASVVEIPKGSEEFLSYEDKYLKGQKKTGVVTEGMLNLARSIDPSGLDEEIKQRVQRDALRLYGLMDAGGVVRFDFMLDGESGEVYFNELNAMPGSFAFYLWDCARPSLLYTDLLDQMIEEALDRKSQELCDQKDFGLKVLSTL